jgi:very-short-patch-repair endonuclease
MQEDADQARTVFLNQRGYRVLRFWDHEVMKDLEAVLQQIAAALENPHPSPLPGQGEEAEERQRFLSPQQGE